MSNDKYTVLCVDDEPINLRLLDMILSRVGYHILTASNGNEALTIMDNNKVDLVLLDVMMPEMDGFETCCRVREKEHLKHIPVLLSSALDMITEQTNIDKSGATDIIAKPFNKADILAKVGRYLA